MLVAFAISIAVHETVAGTIPPAQVATQRETVTSARVVHVTVYATPRPPAPPAPRPIVTPRPVPARTRSLTAPVVHVAAHPHYRAHIVRAAHMEANARPVWDTAVGVSPTGAVTVADGGTGSRGNDSTATSREPPCGFVTFSDPHGSRFDAQTRGFWVDIRMSVHFADGSSQSVLLDYPWYYASEAANPWSDQNLKDPNFPTRFQPPPAAKMSGEPPLVQYVLTHSTRDGMTLLANCP